MMSHVEEEFSRLERERGWNRLFQVRCFSLPEDFLHRRSSRNLLSRTASEAKTWNSTQHWRRSIDRWIDFVTFCHVTIRSRTPLKRRSFSPRSLSADDHTRVKLKRGANDYINANHVQIPSINRKYILTQVNISHSFVANCNWRT